MIDNNLVGFGIHCDGNKSHEPILHMEKYCPLCTVTNLLNLREGELQKYHKQYPLKREVELLERVGKLEAEKEELYCKLADYSETIQHLTNDIFVLENKDKI